MKETNNRSPTSFTPISRDQRARLAKRQTRQFIPPVPPFDSPLASGYDLLMSHHADLPSDQVSGWGLGPGLSWKAAIASFASAMRSSCAYAAASMRCMYAGASCRCLRMPIIFSYFAQHEVAVAQNFEAGIVVRQRVEPLHSRKNVQNGFLSYQHGVG